MTTNIDYLAQLALTASVPLYKCPDKIREIFFSSTTASHNDGNDGLMVLHFVQELVTSESLIVDIKVRLQYLPGFIFLNYLVDLLTNERFIVIYGLEFTSLSTAIIIHSEGLFFNP